MSLNSSYRFNDKYLQLYDPVAKSLEIRRKNQSEGNLSLAQSMDLISDLLRIYQNYYVPNTYEPNVLLFRHMFREPKEGDRILNVSTEETYTVDQVIRNPQTNKWEGIVKINSTKPPDLIGRDLLEFKQDHNYVDFDHAYRLATPNEVSTNSSGDGLSPPPMRPIVSWFLARQEPGARSGKAFGPFWEIKPTLRETLKDPLVSGYTVTVYGQYFDNIVQFDALYIDNKSAEALVEWFSQFLYSHRGVLRRCGVANLHFERRLEDATDQRWRQPIWKRSLQWYFRTEQLTAIYERDLMRIETSLIVSSGFPYRKNPRYIAGQLTSGDLNPSGYRRLFYDQSGTYLFGDTELQDLS